MKYLLSIDQSTSATKAVLFDEAGRVVDQASMDHRQIYPQPGWVEHDAGEIWQNVLTVIRAIAARANLEHLAGLTLTNQRETIVIFDRVSGLPLCLAIVWQCRRSDAICQQLRGQGHGAMVQAKTGLKIDPYFSGSKLTWIMAERPDLAAKLQSGEAVIGTIDTYLIHRLTRGAVFATDCTNASRTLLFDITTLQWDPALCELFQVPMGALADVRESASHFGETDAEGLLPPGTPIVGVMGDSQASLLAQRCFQPGRVKATFGTGTSVLLNIGSQWSPAPEGCVTALAWVQGGVPVYALEGLINFSAATISWLKNQLGLIGEAEESETLACSIPDNGGVYLVPAFAGLGAPWWNPGARAAIMGMSAHTGRAQIVRSGLESIAYQVRSITALMAEGAGLALQSLCVDGGPTRNRFLMQFTADITGTSLEVSQVPESSAWGAAQCGWFTLGYFSKWDEPGCPSPGIHHFLPQIASHRRQPPL